MKFTRCLSIIAIVVVAAPLCASAATDQATYTKDCHNKSGEQAIKACTTALRSATVANWAILYTFRGIQFARMGQLDDAIQDYTKALEYARSSFTYYNRAVAFELKGDHDSALQDFGRAKFRDNDADSQTSLGQSFANVRQYARAIQQYELALEIDPEFLDALISRGDARSALKDFDGALIDYDRAVAVKPENAVSLERRCSVRAYMGRQLDLALADCNEALRLKPRDGNIRSTRGLVNFRAGDFTAAIEDCNVALATDQTNSYDLYVRGLAKLKMGDETGGNKDITTAKNLNPKVTDTYAGYGIAPP